MVANNRSGKSNNGSLPANARTSDPNTSARTLILQSSIDAVQSIASASGLTPTSIGNNINFPLKNVGLIKRLRILWSATINNTGTNPIVPTEFNVLNLFSRVVFNDYGNTVRINVSGLGLSLINNAKSHRPYSASISFDDAVGGYNGAYPIWQAPASIAAGGSATISGVIEIPFSYGDYDLRGALFANLVNATANVQLAINSNPVVATGSDTTSAIYTGTGATGTLTNLSYAVYQEYLDNLPMQGGKYVLPMTDLGTIYDLRDATYSGLTVGSDFPIGYPNYRSFLSTHLIFDNGGTLNPGTDVNYLAIQQANLTNVVKCGPIYNQVLAANRNGVQMPKGVYYFDHRRQPINTITSGNVQLILNPSLVNTGASLMIIYESMLQSSAIGTGLIASVGAR